MNTFLYGLVCDVPRIAGKLGKRLQSDTKFKEYVLRMGDPAPIITNIAQDRLSSYIFGLSPSNFKRKHFFTYVSADGIFSSAFRLQIRNKRCIVPATHFIQGTRAQGFNKPFCIHLIKEKPFFIAGIWDEWKSEYGNEIIYSFAPLIVPANKLLASLGIDQMPAIITAHETSTWLNRGAPISSVKDLLRSYANDRIDIFPLDASLVRNTELNNKSVLQPIGKSFWTTVKDQEIERLRKLREEKLKKEEEENKKADEHEKARLAEIHADYGKNI